MLYAVLKTLIEILKYYYIDVAVAYLMFLCGIGVGAAINQIVEEHNDTARKNATK